MQLSEQYLHSTSPRDLRARPVNKSLAVFVIVFAGHVLLVGLMVNLKNTIPATSLIPALTFIGLPPTNPSPISLDPPSLNFQLSITSESTLIAPETVVMEAPPAEEGTLTASSMQGDFNGVFDPRLRQKLLQGQRPHQQHEFQLDERWTGADGRTYMYVGNGECMVSMPKLDSRERGTQWSSSRVTCGKNDSEKAMDRVMADFESRKAKPK